MASLSPYYTFSEVRFDRFISWVIECLRVLPLGCRRPAIQFLSSMGKIRSAMPLVAKQIKPGREIWNVLCEPMEVHVYGLNPKCLLSPARQRQAGRETLIGCIAWADVYISIVCFCRTTYKCTLSLICVHSLNHNDLSCKCRTVWACAPTWLGL